MKTDLAPWKPTNHKNHKNPPGTMENQLRTMKNHENWPGTVKTNLELLWFLRHEHGAQLTSMNIKASRDEKGAPTDLHDWKNMTSRTGGPNQPFRCLDGHIYLAIINTFGLALYDSYFLYCFQILSGISISKHVVGFITVWIVVKTFVFKINDKFQPQEFVCPSF